jgi:hypothetical protein
VGPAHPGGRGRHAAVRVLRAPLVSQARHEVERDLRSLVDVLHEQQPRLALTAGAAVFPNRTEETVRSPDASTSRTTTRSTSPW